MSWAQRRKATYTISFLFIIISIIFIIVYVFFNKQPTCFDGAQNQGEVGIDCGGPCSILCRAQYSDPTVLWVRWAKVLNNGTYNLLAYAQNPNIGVGALNAPYTFRVYDKNNVLLYSKNGIAYIPPSNTFTVFDDNISINDKVPARIAFEFTPGFTWQKIENKEIGITPTAKNLVDEDTKPKLLVTLKNTTLLPISNIEAIAILYDEFDNAIAFSRTKVDTLASDGTADVVFTWPEKFPSKVYKIEIIPKVLQN